MPATADENKFSVFQKLKKQQCMLLHVETIEFEQE